MSNHPALAPSGRVSRSRVRVSRTRRGPANAPDRMKGMITPWSVGTPRKATRASSCSRSSIAGAPKNVRVAGRVSGPTGCSPSPGIPNLLGRPLYRKPVLPGRLHHGITVHDADATRKGLVASLRDGSQREEKLMKRPVMVMPSVLLGLALVLAGCGGTSTSSGTSSKVSVTPPTSLIKSGTLTDCVDIEYSPMEFFSSASVTDPNQAVGFDVEGARAVAKAFGLQLQIKNTGFDALIPDLTAGRCDIVWTALFVSQKRLAVADAVPYMATGHVVMVPKGNPKNIKTLDDLCGKKVSIQTGGVVEQRINEQNKACNDAGKPAIQIAGYPKVADEFQQIVVGRVDAVWETDTAVADWMIKYPDKYEVGYAAPKTDSYGIYFQKNKSDLQTARSTALKALKADGTLITLAKKHQMDPVVLDVIT